MPTTKGKYSFSTCYNSERALTVQGASSNEQDWCVVFNLAAIEEGIKKGDFKEVNGVENVGRSCGSQLSIHSLHPGS